MSQTTEKGTKDATTADDDHENSHDPPLKLRLKLVSMNLSECKPSAEAPSSWNLDRVTEAIQEELLKSDPDILALQECPSEYFLGKKQDGGVEGWLEKTFGGNSNSNSNSNGGYSTIGTKRSHAGYVALLVKKELLLSTNQGQGQVQVSVSRADVPFMVPAVMAKLKFHLSSATTSVMIASCHLEPFGEGASLRKQQMENMVLASAPSSLPLIVAGDTNMRVAEDYTMEHELGFQDAWKLAGADPATKFTWDTLDHRTGNQDDGSYNCYYGQNTRQYHSRYDRVYIHTHPQNNENLNVSVPSFQLIANRPIAPSQTHFLSDHFGIATTILLHWKENDNGNGNDNGSSKEKDEDDEDEDRKAKRRKHTY